MSDDPECPHVWRVFDHVDRCVVCGDDRPHVIAHPYASDPGTADYHRGG